MASAVETVSGRADGERRVVIRGRGLAGLPDPAEISWEINRFELTYDRGDAGADVAAIQARTEQVAGSRAWSRS